MVTYIYTQDIIHTIHHGYTHTNTHTQSKIYTIILYHGYTHTHDHWHLGFGSLGVNQQL